MSVNPELTEIVALPVPEPPAEPANGHAVEAVEAVASATPVAVKRERPRWIASVAVGVVGVIAAGSLGYLLYGTAQRQYATQRQLTSMQSTLTAAQADAAKKKITADYVSVYVADSGKVELEYQNWVACSNFSTCRTSSQDLLNDLQAFQTARKSATVPSQLAGADADLGDALSAAIAATQQIISAMDSGDLSRFRDGEKKLDAAMLNVAKAQVSLGSYLK
ncbi:MAG TPA: hypothetical protein VJP81_10645 [Candidatus Dormibacteraeota bacterium]|nr:hypothetical protein [Candidatus Dormibacteraeota bacterium]